MNCLMYVCEQIGGHLLPLFIFFPQLFEILFLLKTDIIRHIQLYNYFFN